MKERPILFSAPMVRAILEGRKTQTRRVVKPQPTHRLIEGLSNVTIGMRREDGQVWYDADGINAGREVRCPYGRMGDRLWVREKWAEGGRVFSLPCGEPSWSSHLKARYAATDDASRDGDKSCSWRTRPSIHMPRWASRITLEVVNVRVERLQQISEQDATAEGVEGVSEYAALWDSINGVGLWAENPWVWVVEFRVVPAALRVRQMPGGAS